MTGFRATPRVRPADTAPVRTSLPSDQDLIYLSDVLHGLSWPARTWQIVMAAEYSGADRRTMDRLHGLPDASFHSLHHVGSACAALPGGSRR